MVITSLAQILKKLICMVHYLTLHDNKVVFAPHGSLKIQVVCDRCKSTFPVTVI